MNNNVIFKDRENEPIAPDEALKATSLLYLQEALAKEQYEQCAELVQKAREFGAQQDEVRKVLKESVRGARAGPQNEVDQRIKNRLETYLKGGK